MEFVAIVPAQERRLVRGVHLPLNKLVKQVEAELPDTLDIQKGEEKV